MKNLITPSYIFTPGGSGVGTIDTNIANFDIKLLYAIINITREVIIYAPSLSGRGYTSLTGDTITLEVDTSTHSSSDVLQFVYNSTASYPSIVDVTGELTEAIEAMRMAIQALTRTVGLAQVNPLTGRMLVDGSGVTQPVSGTVSVGTPAVTQSGTWNITNLATIGGIPANSQVQSFERMTADNLRRNISVT
jgi:hypothetical protein